MTLTGADADRLAATGRRFVEAATSLRVRHRELDRLLASSSWSGPDAMQHRRSWAASGDRLAAAAEFVERLGHRLVDHADEQAHAAAAQRAGRPAAPTPVVVRPADPDPVGRRVAAVGRGPTPFGPPRDGRAAVAAAMAGLAEEGRIRRDEIELRALDNGRYVVVLPGVTDLSSNLETFAGWARAAPIVTPAAGVAAIAAWFDNDEPTVRKMRHAIEAARRDDTTVNEYSVATVEALRAAGVPSGAEVMLVGHSFGAYTAVDLAADPSFNAAHGSRPAGYHVHVTDVVAAGADTDWRLDELPADTGVLLANSRVDAVYRIEDLLHRDAGPEHPDHVEVDFWGGWAGSGHDEGHYLDLIRSTDDARVVDRLERIGERYAAGGVRMAVAVPDPGS